MNGISALSDLTGVQIRPISNSCAAEISSVNVARRVTDKEFERTLDALYRYKVIVIRKLRLTLRQLTDFASYFGKFEDYHLADEGRAQHAHNLA